MAIEYFPCYHSYLARLAKLSDQEVGRLFRALLTYSATGECPELTGRESVAFDFIQFDIDQAHENFNERSRKNAENINKRWNTNDTNEYERIPSNTNDTKAKAKAKAKANSIPPIPPAGGTEKREKEEQFEEFWSKYPKKVAKSTAKKAFERVSAPLETLLSAINRQKCSEQWSKDNGQYIPNPATWLNQERWNDELPAPGCNNPSGRELDADEKEAIQRMMLE